MLLNREHHLVVAANHATTFDTLYAWDVRTGQRVWSVPISKLYGRLTRPVAVVSGLFLLITEDYRSYILNAQGELVLQLNDEIIKNFILVSNGENMLVNTDQRLMLMRVPSAHVLWQRELPQGKHAMHNRYKFIPICNNRFTRLTKHSDASKDMIIYNYCTVFKKLRSVEIQRLNIFSGTVEWSVQVLVQTDEEVAQLQGFVSPFHVRLYGEVRLGKFVLVSQLPRCDRMNVVDVRTGAVTHCHCFAI